LLLLHMGILVLRCILSFVAQVVAAKRIAIVLSGLRRSFVYPLVYQNIWTHIVWPIVDVSEVFFALDFDHSGRKYTNYDQNTVDPTEWEKIIALFRPVYIARLLSSRDLSESLRVGRNLIEAREEIRGQRFLWIIRLRPDATYGKVLPPWSEWPISQVAKQLSVVWSTSIGGSCSRSIPRDAHRLGVCLDDNFAIMSRSALKVYVSKWPSRHDTSSQRWCQLFEASTPNCVECRLGCALFLAGVHVGALDIEINLERPPRRIGNTTYRDKITKTTALDRLALETLQAIQPYNDTLLAAEFKRLWQYSNVLQQSSGKYRFHFIVLEACGKHDGTLAQIAYDGKVHRSPPAIKIKANAQRQIVPLATKANKWLGCDHSKVAYDHLLEV